MCFKLLSKTFMSHWCSFIHLRIQAYNSQEILCNLLLDHQQDYTETASRGCETHLRLGSCPTFSQRLGMPECKRCLKLVNFIVTRLMKIVC